MEKKTLIETNASLTSSGEENPEHPFLGWLNFILTDSAPNKNQQGIPESAFASLVESGKLMPIKVAEGQINDGHENALPLGPIAELAILNNQIVGKAALWKVERADAYAMLKQMHDAGESINISWELGYTESSTDEGGVEWITDPILRGATVVGNPAYAGRTQVTAIASASGEPNEPEVEEVVAEDTNAAELESLKSEVTRLTEEVTTLRTYKEERELKDAAEAKFNERLSAIVSAGVSYTDEEIASFKETWLSMNDDAFTNMVAMLKKAAKTSQSSVNIPDVGNHSTSLVDQVRKGLKQMKEKK